MSETDLDQKREALIKSSPILQFTVLRLATNYENPPYEKVQELRKLLADNPDMWQELGDLARTATEGLIDAAGRNDVAKRESVKQGAESLKQKLGYATAPAIEQLAIEQVVLCWAAFYNVQEVYTRARFNDEKVLRSTIESWDKQLTSSQRRYFRALEGLARIRKLSKGIDVVQVNIAAEGGQQVNVAGDLISGHNANLVDAIQAKADRISQVASL